ncbi:DUF7847 domain-containing protein [Natrinema ejinorense]|uniref:DUF7847 domain-containing protein n=1 Tax=Natrinema ejinorense TaxID=373386 RepID=UPI001B802CE2|nr:hypothetical protein [Natrinema ejinorense]
MAVVQALRRSPGALVRTPALVVPAIVLLAFQLPQVLLQSTRPLLASVLSLGASVLLLVAAPFFQGGMIGMADEALEGRSSLGTFVAAGKAHYVQILIAYLLLLVVNMILGVVFFFAGFVALLFGLAELGALPVVVLGGVAAIVALIYLVFLFFLQFYAQAIVIDGETALDGLKRSYRVVRSNLLATIGYMLAAVVGGGLVGLFVGGLSMLATPEAAELGLPVLSTGGLIAAGAVATLISSVVSAFLLVYSVSFYRLVTQ